LATKPVAPIPTAASQSTLMLDAAVDR
jgi:hypothetical protein